MLCIDEFGTTCQATLQPTWISTCYVLMNLAQRARRPCNGRSMTYQLNVPEHLQERSMTYQFKVPEHLQERSMTYQLNVPEHLQERSMTYQFKVPEHVA